MDFGKIATKGQKHIPTAAWNAMREVAQQFEDGLPSFEATAASRNPFLITIENATGDSIEPFAVLEISDAMFPNRTGTDYLNEAINRGVELKGIKPSGDEEKNIAITLDGGPNGTLVQAVVVGAVPCKVMVETSSAENYKYAVPVANQTGYLKAAESGNIRILWKESGTGIKWAFVLLDAKGEGHPLKVAAKMPNTDTRPEGAFLLDSTDTWLYADSIDSFAKQNDSAPPAIVNPCGYPIDRPVIIGKCEGFPGNAEEEESENSGSSSSSSSESSDSPIPDAVAIACDVREFFVINNGYGSDSSNNSSSSSSSSSSNSSSNQIDSDYAYGSLEYIQYDTSLQRWLPATGTDAYQHRLAVCQRDLPAGWSKEYRMPYFSPESNYGAEPWTANDSNSPSSSGQFTERCGVKPGEHEFSNQRLDYHYKNGRFSYEPRFIFIGSAKAGSGTGSVAIEIEGNDYEVNFPSARSATSYPDIYYGDQITVEVDASGAEPILTAIDYPMDFPEDTVILTHSGSPGRGWEDVTNDTNNADRGNNDLLVWKNPQGVSLANWTNHICTCTHTAGSGGGGNVGHTCSHDRYTAAETSAKWYKKVKTGALK